jgi:hypothetical protein
MRFYHLFRSLGITALLLLIALPVKAEDSINSDEWQFSAEVYLWAASLETTPTGGNTVNIDITDILRDLDMAMMTTLDARKGKWSLVSDIIYMSLSADEKGTAELVGNPVQTKIDVGMDTWIVTAAGGYTITETDKYSLDLLVGARHLSLDLPLKFQIDTIKKKVTPSDNAWDGIIGVKGEVDLADKWFLTYYADAGAGDSDLTLQTSVALNYRFKKVDATFGYRYLDWDFDDDSDIEDITLEGPYAGVKFIF